MPIDYTPITAAEMLVSRLDLPDTIDAPSLEYNDDSAGWTELMNLNDFDWDLVQVVNPGVSKPYLRLRILDNEEDSLREIVYQTEAVSYDGTRYKVSKEVDPFGTARVWVFRLDRMERLSS